MWTVIDNRIDALSSAVLQLLKTHGAKHPVLCQCNHCAKLINSVTWVYIRMYSQSSHCTVMVIVCHFLLSPLQLQQCLQAMSALSRQMTRL